MHFSLFTLVPDFIETLKGKFLRRPKPAPTIWALFILLSSFFLYSLTVNRHLYWMDSAEFVNVGKTLGISHPTGYPLLTILCRIFSLIPFGTIPLRINIISSIAAAFSGFFLYLIIYRITKSWTSSVLGSLAWLFSYELWHQTTAIEVYTLHTLFLTVIFYLSLVFRESKNFKILYLLAFISGLSLTNHLTAILFLPMILILVFSSGTDVRSTLKQKKFSLILIFLLGLTTYLYIPLRTKHLTFFNWGNPNDFSHFFGFIQGKEFQYRFLALPPFYLTSEIFKFLKELLKQFLLFAPLGILGIFFLIRKQKQIAISLLIFFLLNSGYAILYNIPDKEGYYLASFLVFGIFTGLGINFILQNSKKPVVYLLFGLLLVPLIINYPRNNQRNNRSLEDFSLSISQELEPNSIIILDDFSLYHGLLYTYSSNPNKAMIILEFLLPLDWYIKELRRNYPNLILPQEVEQLIKTMKNQIRKAPKIVQGEIRKKTGQQIKKAIILANIDKPIFLYFRDESVWQERFDEFYLKTKGILYKVVKEKSRLDTFSIEFPPSKKYNFNRLKDEFARNVSQRYALVYNRRGIINFLKKEYDSAEKDFFTALEYFPNYPEVFENLGTLYYETGDKEKALRYWEDFLKRLPDSPDAPKIREAIRRIREM